MWRPRRWLSARYPRIPCLPPAISHTGERRGGISSYLTIFIFLNYPAPKYPVKSVPMEYLIFIILSITILSRGLFVHSLGSVPNRTSWRRTYATSRCPRHTKRRWKAGTQGDVPLWGGCPSPRTGGWCCALPCNLPAAATCLQARGSSWDCFLLPRAQVWRHSTTVTAPAPAAA